MRIKELGILLEDDLSSNAMDNLIDTALSTASSSPAAAQVTLKLMSNLIDRVQNIVQDNMPAATPIEEPVVDELPPEPSPEPELNLEPEPEPEEEELTESNEAAIDQVDEHLTNLIAMRGDVIGNPAALARIDNLIDSYRKKIEDVQQQAHAAGVKAGKEEQIAEHAALNKYVELMLTRLPVQPNNKKMLTAAIKSIFQEDHISVEDARVFLEAAASGSIIDMEKLLAAGKGNIRNFVRPELLGTFNKVIDDFFKLDLGSSTGGNIGPGEIAFILLGSPAEKVKKGDLRVANEKFEVKSSGLKKSGKGKSGSVFGGDHISTAKALWPDIKKIFARYGIHNTEETVVVDDKKKKSARFKINSKGLKQFNDAFNLNQLDLNTRARLLADIASTLYPDVADQKRLIKQMAQILKKNGGELEANNNSEFMRFIAKLALDAYRKDESKDNFIYFNQSSKNFHVYRGDELDQELSSPEGDLEVMRGIDWNDGQYKASPGLYLK